MPFILDQVLRHALPFLIQKEENSFFWAIKGLLSPPSPAGFEPLFFGKDKEAHGRASEASADHSIFTANFCSLAFPSRGRTSTSSPQKTEAQSLLILRYVLVKLLRVILASVHSPVKHETRLVEFHNQGKRGLVDVAKPGRLLIFCSLHKSLEKI